VAAAHLEDATNPAAAHAAGRNVRYMYGGAIILQGVTNKDIIRIEQPQQDK
jgi:hypothetical protein